MSTGLTIFQTTITVIWKGALSSDSNTFSFSQSTLQSNVYNHSSEITVVIQDFELEYQGIPNYYMSMFFFKTTLLLVFLYIWGGSFANFPPSILKIFFKLSSPAICDSPYFQFATIYVNVITFTTNLAKHDMSSTEIVLLPCMHVCACVYVYSMQNLSYLKFPNLTGLLHHHGTT